MNSIISLDEYKTLAKITNNSQDGIINLFIPIVEAMVRKECKFSETQEFTADLKIFAFLYIQFYSSTENCLVSSTREGNLSYNFVNKLPDDVTAMLNKHRKFRVSYDK